MSAAEDSIRQHLEACKGLLASALEQCRGEDPDWYSGIALASQHGAAFRVITGLSVAGLCETSIDLVAPDGQVTNIVRVKLEHGSRH